jgi:hypothetical protein
MTTRTVDPRGRLSLGKAFANRLVIIKELENGMLQVIPAEAVPVPEAWLYENREAFLAVTQGLQEARAGQFAEPPDRDADAAWTDDGDDE